MEKEIIIVPEGVLLIKEKDGPVIAMVYNDLNRRSQVFGTFNECGTEDIKSLLEKIAGK